MSGPNEKNLRLDKFIRATTSILKELRDELTAIGELDLLLQNATKKQERQAFMFFQNASTLTRKNRDSVFHSLLTDFESIIEVANEKVNIAERLWSMLNGRLGQLDREITMLKIELEVENPGVTEIIQQRVSRDDYLAKSVRCKDTLRKMKKFKLTKRKGTTSAPTLRMCETREIDKPMHRQIIYDAVKVNNNNNETVRSNVEPTSTDDPTLYCICNRQAFGDMIACDNELCPYEWFHYACVNMTMAPQGKWYCPKCTVCQVCLERRSTKCNA